MAVMDRQAWMPRVDIFRIHTRREIPQFVVQTAVTEIGQGAVVCDVDVCDMSQLGKITCRKRGGECTGASHGVGFCWDDTVGEMPMGSVIRAQTSRSGLGMGKQRHWRTGKQLRVVPIRQMIFAVM